MSCCAASLPCHAHEMYVTLCVFDLSTTQHANSCVLSPMPSATQCQCQSSEKGTWSCHTTNCTPNQARLPAIRPSAASNVILLSRAEVAAMALRNLHPRRCNPPVCPPVCPPVPWPLRFAAIPAYILTSWCDWESVRALADYTSFGPASLIANTQALPAHFTSACTPPKTLVTFSYPAFASSLPASSASTRSLAFA